MGSHPAFHRVLPWAKFCSDDCVSRHLQKTGFKQETVNKCANCGKLFLGNNRKFCGTECYGASRKQGWKSMNPSNEKLQILRRKEYCAICGKEISHLYTEPLERGYEYPPHACSPVCQKKLEERQKTKEQEKVAPDNSADIPASDGWISIS